MGLQYTEYDRTFLPYTPKLFAEPPCFLKAPWDISGAMNSPPEVVFHFCSISCGKQEEMLYISNAPKGTIKHQNCHTSLMNVEEPCTQTPGLPKRCFTSRNTEQMARNNIAPAHITLRAHLLHVSVLRQEGKCNYIGIIPRQEKTWTTRTTRFTTGLQRQSLFQIALIIAKRQVATATGRQWKFLRQGSELVFMQDLLKHVPMTYTLLAW